MHGHGYDHCHPLIAVMVIVLQWIVHFLFIVNAKWIFLANAV